MCETQKKDVDKSEWKNDKSCRGLDSNQTIIQDFQGNGPDWKDQKGKTSHQRLIERKTMEEAKGVEKHVLLAKFKEGIPSDEIEKLIKGYANLVNLIEPMKAFHW
ncbi:hypothetical protein GH714_034402 [Hevea brasiliensis]|uniref:Stress-response A/B barrel domain-containing protein n=1 Tax=Hevea brasiliensis TaxID=3981 RepID=A0A6A6NAR9_HEVBR|nr:hypothetical protein GH714_034402 [Hevea brasiliensis]